MELTKQNSLSFSYKSQKKITPIICSTFKVLEKQLARLRKSGDQREQLDLLRGPIRQAVLNVREFLHQQGGHILRHVTLHHVL